MSVGDIALLLDGEICSDSLSQVELLAEGKLSRHGLMRLSMKIGRRALSLRNGPQRSRMVCNC